MHVALGLGRGGVRDELEGDDVPLGVRGRAGGGRDRAAPGGVEGDALVVVGGGGVGGDGEVALLDKEGADSGVGAEGGEGVGGARDEEADLCAGTVGTSRG